MNLNNVYQGIGPEKPNALKSIDEVLATLRIEEPDASPLQKGCVSSFYTKLYLTPKIVIRETDNYTEEQEKAIHQYGKEKGYLVITYLDDFEKQERMNEDLERIRRDYAIRAQRSERSARDVVLR